MNRWARNVSAIATVILITFSIFSGFVSSDALVPLFCSLPDCVSALGNSPVDGASYIRAAEILNNFGVREALTNPEHKWYFLLWPPGMAGMYWLPSVIFGISTPVVFLYAVLLSLAWSAAFILPIYFSKSNANLVAVLVAEVLVFFSHQFQALFTGTQLFGSEPLSLALFALSGLLFMAAMVQFLNSRRALLVAIITSGFLMGVAAYLRAVFDFIILGSLLLIAFGILLSVVLNVMRKGGTGTLLSMAGWKDNYLPFLLWAATALLVTLPWRILIFFKLVPGATSFSPAGDRVWINDWIPTSLWEDPAFPVKFGINGLCRAYQQTCDAIFAAEMSGPAPYTGYGTMTIQDFRSEAINSIVSGPWAWLLDRSILGLARFGDFLGEGAVFLVSLLVLCLLIGFQIFMMTRYFKLGRYKAASAILLTIFWGLISVGPLFLSSFEPRYFYIFWTNASFVSVFLIAIFSPNGRKKQSPLRSIRLKPAFGSSKGEELVAKERNNHHD